MKIFNLVSIYIASLIGAGFASGLEIKTYFADFGIRGIYMIFVAGILFFITSYKMFVISLKSSNGGFIAFCDEIFLFFSPAIKIISILFMVSTLSAMLSCGSELFGNTYAQRIMFSAVLAFLCFFLIRNGDKGLSKVSMFLFPVMLLGIISVCIESLEPSVNIESKILNFSGVGRKGFFMSPFIYVSYNTITALPIIFSSKRFIHSEKNAFFSAFFSSVIITMIMLLCGICIILKFDKISSGIPLYDISASKMIYKIILLSAVITTAVSNLLAASDMLEELSGLGASRLRKYICAAGFLFSLAGFSRLVNLVYTFFGCIGIFEVVVILFERKTLKKQL